MLKWTVSVWVDFSNQKWLAVHDSTGCDERATQVNLPHIINFRAVYGANVVTLPSKH